MRVRLGEKEALDATLRYFEDRIGRWARCSGLWAPLAGRRPRAAQLGCAAAPLLTLWQARNPPVRRPASGSRRQSA